MDKFNEILKAHGLDDTAITGILDDLKENKLYFTSHENMDIRYPKLKNDFDGQGKRLEEALATIGQMEKSTKGNEEAQKQLAEHAAREQALIEELEKVKILSEAKFQLKDAGALDVDYLLFKLQEKGELFLGEDGKIKDWDDKLAGLKTQIPTQFETKGKQKNIIENKLPEPDNSNTVSREAFNKMGYNDRLKLYKENPEAYAELTK